MLSTYGINFLRQQVKVKQEFRTLLGREKFTQLYPKFKHAQDIFVESQTSPGQKIKLGLVKIRDTILGKCVAINPFCEELGLKKYNMTFYGKEIDWENIVKKIHEFEIKTINARKVPLSEDDLKPKLMEKLFSPKYNPARRFDENFNPVTTVIDRKTQKPVEVYITKEIDQNGENTQYYNMFLRNPNGKDELIGTRSFSYSNARKTIMPGVMQAFANDRYEGIGLRLHQIAIEMMLKNNFDNIEIYATSYSFPFHYKSLFRAKSVMMESKYAQIFEQSLINEISSVENINYKGLHNLIVPSSIAGFFNGGKTRENIQKFFFYNRFVGGTTTPMFLDKNGLEIWKNYIVKQPIFLCLK